MTSPGIMIAVVGPSGAGKDTLIAEAMRHFPDESRLHVIRRVITRTGDAGGEDHESVDAGEFERRRLRGDFAVSWEAHGLHYAVPAEARRRIDGGQAVIANGSRSALPAFGENFPRLLVLNVVAAPAVLAERLRARGRESRAEIEERLKRAAPEGWGDFEVFTIDNSGDVADAVEKMVAFLKAVLLRLPEFERPVA